MSGRDVEEDRVKKYHLLLTIRTPAVRKSLITAAVESESKKENVNRELHSSIKPTLLMIMQRVGYQKEKSVYVDHITAAYGILEITCMMFEISKKKSQQTIFLNSSPPFSDRDFKA